jgi:preprotein translocase subunit SecA
VLVGTISVEVSEHLSKLLERRGVQHNVLNAKQHEREAEIIKFAGEAGSVTIATNMAGRGVDIKLGAGIVDLGGLYVLGTERHEARRIDNQLRGRSGRQGDPGESRFYLSAQDDLVRLFAGDRIYRIIERFKIPDDQPMEAGILSKQIENAQKKVEEQNFVSRKNVLKYDDVMNVQRMVIYEQRRRVLEGADLSEEIAEWLDDVVARIVFSHTESEYAEEWDLDALFKEMETLYETEITPDEIDDPQNLDMFLDVNGERCQTGNTRTMIFSVAHVISYTSQFMALEPGDIITTGTPPGVGLGMKPQRFLKAGDEMRLGIAGLGEQRQKVVAG